MDFYDGGWAPYVSVAERRDKAQRKLKSLEKKGESVSQSPLRGALSLVLSGAKMVRQS